MKREDLTIEVFDEETDIAARNYIKKLFPNDPIFETKCPLEEDTKEYPIWGYQPWGEWVRGQIEYKKSTTINAKDLLIINEEHKEPDMTEKAVATKKDSTKVDFALVEPAFIAEVAKVMTLGSVKYGRFNWKIKGMDYTRVMAALLRHAYQWLGGEDKDKESGCSHLAHVACNCMMLMHWRAKETEFYQHCNDIFDQTTDEHTRVLTETEM